MSLIRRFIISISALLVFSSVAMSTSVGAMSGDSSTNTPTTEDNPTAITHESKDLTEQFKQQAQARIADKKAQVKEHTQEQRQKACEARKNNLTKRMSNAVAQAEKHKATFDKIYDKVKTFKDTKNLDVTNYDSLIAATDQAQSDAQASIDSLKSLDITIDCTSQNVAQSVATFQAAVKSTRDSLKAYRSSITDLIKAVKAVTGDQSSSDQSEVQQ